MPRLKLNFTISLSRIKQRQKQVIKSETADDSNENHTRSVISEFPYHIEWITHSKIFFSLFNQIVLLILSQFWFGLFFGCFGGQGGGEQGNLFGWFVWLFCFPQKYTLNLADGLYPKYNNLVGVRDSSHPQNICLQRYQCPEAF